MSTVTQSITPKLEFDKRIKGQIRIILSGSWSGQCLGEGEALLNNALRRLRNQVCQVVLQDIYIDANGARLVTSKFLNKRVDLQIPPHLTSLFNSVQAFKKPLPLHQKPLTPLQHIAEPIGRFMVESSILGKRLIAFFGEIIVFLIINLRKIRWPAMAKHIEEAGVTAVPIIALTSFLIGVVLAYQGVNQLRRFGAEIFTVDGLGIGVLREIGVLLTSIVVAGRTASAVTAQIGTMKLNQEIDAIRMMGFDPMGALVVPRILGLLISLPALVFLSDVMGLFGGMLMMKVSVGLSASEYLSQLQKAVSTTHFWVGMSKAPLFAIIISIVGCFRGFAVKGSAESIGIMTTRSVVESIFLVIIFDALVSVIYSYLQI